MSEIPEPLRILWVFAWLVVGGEETEVRLLSTKLDRARYRIDVLPCLRRKGMTEQTHRQLESAGVPVDQTAYALGFEDTVRYLSGRIPAYDVVVASQAVPDVHPAFALLAARGIVPPPLLEHGGLMEELLRSPLELTTRYVGVCRSIREAAARRMPDRPHHALRIPSMVDLAEFSPGDRAEIRAGWEVPEGAPLIGWVGRLDRKKRVEDFLRAATLVRRARPDARFVVIGGPDAFMPEYADELRALASRLELGTRVRFTGDRADVPRLLSALDVFVWLSRGEGMPHVIAEAGAARLPVVATRDNGTAEQISDGETGLFVPHEDPPAAARAILRLIANPELRVRLGERLRARVEEEYSTAAVLPLWEALFEELVAAGPRSLTHC